MVAAVRSVGLAGYRNTGYPRGLRSLVEGTPARYAVIDTGTNSVKLHVAEPSPDGGWRTIVDRVEITRLGAGLAPSRQDRPRGRSTRTVDRPSGMMAREADAAGRRAIVAVGTAGLRMAQERVGSWRPSGRARPGSPSRSSPVTRRVVSPISRSSPALGRPTGTARGLRHRRWQLPVHLRSDGPAVGERFSLRPSARRAHGALRVRRRGDPEGRSMAALAAIGERPPPAPRPATPRCAGGHGGRHHQPHGGGVWAWSPMTRMSVGRVLERAEVDRQIELLPLARRRCAAIHRGLQPKRAEVILAGACIVRAVMGLLGKRS